MAKIKTGQTGTKVSVSDTLQYFRSQVDGPYAAIVSYVNEDNTLCLHVFNSSGSAHGSQPGQDERLAGCIP